MRRLRRLLRRLTSWSTTARDEERLRAEFEEHIVMQTEENLRAGLSPVEARRQAALKFGSVEAIKDAYRDQRGLPFLEMLSGDTRDAIRGLRRTPAFTATVIVTLALAIGANAAIFAVIDTILIKPLPYPHAEALVSVWHTAPGVPGVPGTIGCTPSMSFTYREENTTFEHVGVWRSGDASVTASAEPELLRTLIATYGVLDAVGVKPLVGRSFSRADDTPGSPETVILTYGYWQRRFGGDRSVIGRALTIESRPRVVIGVMPEDFRFQNDPEVILPARFNRNTLALGLFNHQGIARLKPGVTLEQANADVARMLELWLKAWPPNPGMNRTLFQDARFGSALRPLKQDIVGNIGTTLWVVMGTLALVLVIACANVANLLLVRAEARQQELTIRAALGAGLGRIARALFVESMTLGLLGGAAGLGLAYGALQILVAKGPETLPRLRDIGIDPITLLFTLGVALLSGLLFGVFPVVKYARPRIATALRGGGRTFSDGRERHRARNTLVVAQVALALVLLIGSGLMVRTFQHLRDVQPGFTDPEQVQLLHSMISPAVAQEPEHVMQRQHEILEKLAAIPGVTSAALSNAAPMENFGSLGIPVYAEDKTFAEGQVPPLRRIRQITPAYFKTMGTRIIAGRDFTWTDLHEKRHVAIVSENLAREWWGVSRAALGKRIREGAADPWREIVGVVEDVYDDGVHVKPPAFAYWPALMDRYVWSGGNTFVLGFGTYAIRSSRTGTDDLLTEAQQVMWSLNGRRPVFLVTTLEAFYDRSMAQTSFTLVMLAIAAGMGLVLGIVGIYGVIAYVVSQRIREIGIRTALGARPAGLLGMFVRQGLWLAVIGAALGLVAATGLTSLMSSLLFGVTALDPVTYTAVTALLIMTSVLASYLPARRAITVDPVQALRAD